MSDDKPVIVTLSCEASPGTETEEIDRAEWEAMSPGQRLAYVQAAAGDHAANQGGWGWWIDNPDDAAMVGDSAPDPLRELAEWLVSLDGSWRRADDAIGEAIARARQALGHTEEG